jgi:small subunit ribosomal protein S9
MVTKVVNKTKDNNNSTVAKDFKYYATGKRKSAVARVWLQRGKGEILVNKHKKEAYFPRASLLTKVLDPLQVTNTLKEYDVIALIKGGGISGQAEALRHGIARALLMVNPDFRKDLKVLGFLTRDPREKEAKKYGRKKARKGFQYRKR